MTMITKLGFPSVLCFIFLVQASHQDSDPKVTTKLGTVVGSVKKTPTGKKFYSFSGIPYAKPPIGELRFKAPQPAAPWKGELQAKNDMIMCTQALVGSPMGTEDCLVLNVHTPWDPSTKSPTSPYNVMVWIHGGGFVAGGTVSLMSGEPHYMMEHDIVLVTVNYRLGVFGFLSTEDSEAPGNYGLLDQLEALKWVKDNVASFGGNPQQVTLFGNSAGSASVHLHMLSPLSKGLFHRAIGQSGAANAPWVMTSVAKQSSEILAKKVGCPITPSCRLVRCLRKKDAKKLVSTDVIDKNKRFGWFPFVWTPRIDIESKKPFLPAHPIELMKTGQYNTVPFLTGYTRDEGAFFIAHPKPIYDSIVRAFKSNWDNSCKAFLGFVSYNLPEEIGTEQCKRVRREYIDSDRAYKKSEKDYVKLLTESMAIVPCLKMIELMSQHHPVYSYRFDHDNGELSWFNLLEPGGSAKGYIPHADELMFLFRFSRASWALNSEQYKVVQIITKIWTDFAKTGVATIPNKEDAWPRATWPHHKYVSIDTHPSIEANDFKEVVDRFEDIYRHTLYNVDVSHKDEL